MPSEAVCRTSSVPAAFWMWGVGPLAIVYGVFLQLQANLKVEHVIVLGALVLLSYLKVLHQHLSLVFPFFLFAILYDALRYLMPIFLPVMKIHVFEPYALEIMLFGQKDGLPMTHHLLYQLRNPCCDLLAALAYVLYIFETFALGALWLFRDRCLLKKFAWSFLLLNVLGFVTYFLYPAAPPWYVEQYGFGPALLDVPASPAHLASVDVLLGIDYFQTMYSRSSAVFGAIPSLHAAYPFLAWLSARSYFRRTHWLLLVFWALVGTSAVYLGHHYLIDVLFGVLYSLVVYFFVEILARRASRTALGRASAASTTASTPPES